MFKNLGVENTLELVEGNPDEYSLGGVSPFGQRSRHGKRAEARRFFDAHRPRRIGGLFRPLSEADSSMFSEKICSLSEGLRVSMFRPLGVFVMRPELSRKIFGRLVFNSDTRARSFDGFNELLERYSIIAGKEQGSLPAEIGRLGISASGEGSPVFLHSGLLASEGRDAIVEEHESLVDFLAGDMELDKGSEYSPKINFGKAKSVEEAEIFIERFNNDPGLVYRPVTLEPPEPLA